MTTDHGVLYRLTACATVVVTTPIEIILPGHFVPIVGLRRQPLWARLRDLVGEGRPSAAGPRGV